MLNLVFCLLFLCMGLGSFYYEFKHNLVHNYNKVIVYIIRCLSFFCFGFMAVETVKWLCGVETLIF